MGLLGMGACAGPAPDTELAGSESAIIYGLDDRKDVHQVEDVAMQKLARDALVALVPHNRLALPQSGGVKLLAPKLGDMKFTTREQQVFPLCASEPFRTQLAAADCTGVLIDDDLVLTAGHCFESQNDCQRYAYLFDYFEAAAGALEPLSSSDLYACRELVSRTVSGQGSSSLVDFAIVRLDRPAAARHVVSLRATVLVKDEPLTAIGYPSGLPAKVDQGARVIDGRGSARDFFLLNSDTFAGSSGSGIFDQEGKLAGVLVRGGYDFVLSEPGGNCLVSNVLSDEPGAMHDWEEATYAQKAVDALCAMEYPSERLCGQKGRCGDGFCSLSEDAEGCPADCADQEPKSLDDHGTGVAAPEPDGGLPNEQDAGTEPPAMTMDDPGGDCSTAQARNRSTPLALLLAGLTLFWRRRRAG